MDIEKKLQEEVKEEYLNKSVPEDLCQYIEKGMNKRKRHTKTFRNIIKVAACVVLVFLASVRLSPTFAEAVSEIPLLDRIVGLINYDKSLKYAVDNQYLQVVGNFDEHEGIRLTVDNIIADEGSMFIFYTIRNDSQYKNDRLRIHPDSFTDKEGNELMVSYSWDPRCNDFESNEKNKYLGKIDITFGDDSEIPDKVILNAQFSILSDTNEEPIQDGKGKDIRENSRMLDAIWKVEIPIDKQKIENMKEVYEVNKEVKVDVHKITINTVTIYPTRALIDVSFDPHNSVYISQLENLRIIDEKGEAFASIKNGISAKRIEDNRVIYYIDSSYFRKPKEIHLIFDGIRYIEKDKRYVEVDIDNNTVLTDLGDHIVFQGIVKKEMDKCYVLKFDVYPQKQNHTYGVFSSIFKDAKGDVYSSKWEESSSNMDEKSYYLGYCIDIDKNYEGNIILERQGYINLFKEKVRVEIGNGKLEKDKK